MDLCPYCTRELGTIDNPFDQDPVVIAYCPGCNHYDETQCRCHGCDAVRRRAASDPLTRLMELDDEHDRTAPISVRILTELTRLRHAVDRLTVVTARLAELREA